MFLHNTIKRICNASFVSALRRKLDRYRLGELLLSRGIITNLQLEYALVEQEKTGEKLGRILRRQGAISVLELYYKLAVQWCTRATVFGLALLMHVLTPSITNASTEITSPPVRQTVSVEGSTQNYPGLFGVGEIKSDDISQFTKWTSMIERYDEQLNSVAIRSTKILMWKNALYKLKHRSKFEQLDEVNSYFNSLRYIEDKDNYNKSDYWATPIEFISNGGDCEDFAIAKYASLLQLGFAPAQLRISIVHDKIKNIHHAVLVVHLEEGTFVLDNQSKTVGNIASITRYEPIFSINSDHWWLHKKI